MAKEKLTDAKIAALKPAPKGSRYELMDTTVPGFGVRVGPSKKVWRTFILIARYPETKPNERGVVNPTRRRLGEYPALTLEQAHDKAWEWLKLIRKGIDPVADEKREVKESEQAKIEQESRTFGRAIEDYIERKVRKTKKAKDVEREIRKELIPRWEDWKVSEITADDIRDMATEIADRGAVYQAHNMYNHIRSFFSWLNGSGQFKKYGVAVSPCWGLKISTIVGPKKSRTRVLSDQELRALWEAASDIGFPYGSLFQIAALTGQRIMADIGKAKWSEIDLDAKTWFVPQARFKSDVDYTFPISDVVVDILKSLPQYPSGKYVFSANGGRKHVNGLSKAKARLARIMREKLDGELPDFILHDIRRTFRTRLAELKVSPHIAEAAYGHGKKGIERVYNQYEYQPEIRDAMDAWAIRLRDILEPPPENVVKLDTARA